MKKFFTKLWKDNNIFIIMLIFVLLALLANNIYWKINLEKPSDQKNSDNLGVNVSLPSQNQKSTYNLQNDSIENKKPSVTHIESNSQFVINPITNPDKQLGVLNSFVYNGSTVNTIDLLFRVDPDKTDHEYEQIIPIIEE